MAARAGAGPVGSQEPGASSGLSHVYRGQELDPSPAAFLGMLAGNWIRNETVGIRTGVSGGSLPYWTTVLPPHFFLMV